MCVAVDKTRHYDTIGASENLDGRILRVNFVTIADGDDNSIINGNGTVLKDRSNRIHRYDGLPIYDQINLIIGRRGGCAGQQWEQNGCQCRISCSIFHTSILTQKKGAALLPP